MICPTSSCELSHDAIVSKDEVADSYEEEKYNKSVLIAANLFYSCLNVDLNLQTTEDTTMRVANGVKSQHHSTR